MVEAQLEHGQDIRDRTFEFACEMAEFSKDLYGTDGIGRVMVPQLLACGTSCAAMLEEARAAESRRDFISKCSIALKETREVHVRLRVCERCRVGSSQRVTKLRAEANEVVAILTAILRNTRRGSLPNS